MSDTHTGVRLLSNFFIQNNFIEDDIFLIYKNGEIFTELSPKETSSFSDYNPFPLLTLKQNISLSQNEADSFDYFYRFVKKPLTLLGTALHYYLSKIEYDSQSARKFAMDFTLQKYGSILEKNDLAKIVNSANTFLDNNPEYFLKSLWDTVLMEYSIFDNMGKEFRIDRLLINNSEKKILILDFKTGEIYDERQLVNYKKILASIFKKDFEISTKFLEIKIN